MVKRLRMSLWLVAGTALMASCAFEKMHVQPAWEKETAPEAAAAKEGRFSLPYDKVFNAVVELYESQSIPIASRSKADGYVKTEQFMVGMMGPYLYETTLVQEAGYVQVKWKGYTAVGGRVDIMNDPAYVRGLNEDWNYRLYKKLFP